MLDGRTICRQLESIDPNWRSTLSKLYREHAAYISMNTSNEWENGGLMRLSKLRDIADFYHVRISYLIDEETSSGSKTDCFSDALKYLDDLRNTPGYSISFRFDNDDPFGKKHAISMDISSLPEYDTTSDIDLMYTYLEQTRMLRDSPCTNDVIERGIEQVRGYIIDEYKRRKESSKSLSNIVLNKEVNHAES